MMTPWPFAFLRPDSGSSLVREEKGPPAAKSAFPFFPDPDPLISRPALYNHRKAEVITTAQPILCVCVLTAPGRSLAGLTAVGRVKRQLFVSAFHENLWLNLSRAWKRSAVLLLIQSARRKQNRSSETRFVWMASLSARGSGASEEQTSVTVFSGATETQSPAIKCEHLSTFWATVFLTKQKWVSHRVPVETQSRIWLRHACHKSARQITFRNLVPF